MCATTAIDVDAQSVAATMSKLESPMRQQQQRRKGLSRRYMWIASLTLSVSSLTLYQLGRFVWVTPLVAFDSTTTRHLGADHDHNQSNDQSLHAFVARNDSSDATESDDTEYGRLPFNKTEALMESTQQEAPPKPVLIREVMWDEEPSINVTRPLVQSWTKGSNETKMTPHHHYWETTQQYQKLVEAAKEGQATAPSGTAAGGAKVVTNPKPKKKEQKLTRKAFIDIISIGSLTKPKHQSAQQRTFGSHPAVRSFYKINELNDTDTTCYTNLTLANVNRAANFCGQLDGQSYESTLIRKKLRPFQEYRKSTGWLCAQKRPIDGLWAVLQRYKVERPPSYLVIVDDDTYINMDPLVGTLHNAHSPNELFILGGCVFTLPRELRFTFPYGGFASILTRKVIENLLRPIYCSDDDPDGFTRLACWRLDQNHVGERQFFRDGMSVADLLYVYSSQLAFTKVNQWKNGVGFCFHSDQAIGYFFGYYHVGVPDHRLNKAPSSDKLRKLSDFSYVTIGYGNQCDNERDNCSDESMICHYQRPSQMVKLYNDGYGAAATQ